MYIIFNNYFIIIYESFIFNKKIRHNILKCKNSDLDIYDKFEIYSLTGNKIMQDEYLSKI